jgi:hypothetical protein
MPELSEETKTPIVTYAPWGANDPSTADLESKVNEYVWQHLPLTSEQKVEFRRIFLANAEEEDDTPSNDEDG